MELVKGFSFVSENGVSVRIEETPKRELLVLSLSGDGKEVSASLNYEMFMAITDLKYKIDVQRPAIIEKEDA